MGAAVRHAGRALSSLLSSESAGCAWSELRRLGVPLWVKDDGELRRLVDAAARGGIRGDARSRRREPVRALYAALGRTRRPRGPLQSRERHEAGGVFVRELPRIGWEAALKNAYALVSKHEVRVRRDVLCARGGARGRRGAGVAQARGPIAGGDVARLAPADARSRPKISAETAPPTRRGIMGGGATTTACYPRTLLRGSARWNPRSRPRPTRSPRLTRIPGALTPAAETEAPLPRASPRSSRTFCAGRSCPASTTGTR